MAIRKIGLNYYAYYIDLGGHQRTMALKTKDLATAKKRHDTFFKALNAAKATAHMIKRNAALFPAEVQKKMLAASPVPEYHPRDERLKLSEMLSVARQHRELSPRHVATFKLFCAAVAPKKYAGDITPETAQAFLDCYYGKGNGKSYNNALTQLNVIFKMCLVRAKMATSPFAAVPRRVVREIDHYRPFSADEFRAIFSAAVEPWKTAALISWHTALRCETCFRLAWRDIDAADQSLTIMPGKTARFGRAVYVPIHPELWAHLLTLPRPADDTTPILSQWSYYIHYPGQRNKTYFKGLLDALNICSTSEGKAGFHSLRASFVTRCDEAGISRRATKGVAGHAADEMTDLYSHDKATARQILDLPGVLINPM